MKRQCKFCNEVFYPAATKGRRPSYCSPECRKEDKAMYNQTYCASTMWKNKRKAKRDKLKQVG